MSLMPKDTRDGIARQRVLRDAQIVEVIRVIYFQGQCTKDDPGREVVAYYTTDGKLIGNDDRHEAPTLDEVYGEGAS